MTHRVWIGIIVTFAFAAMARAVRGASFSGCVAGGLICFVLYLGAGPGAFAALVSVFVLTWVATRFGYHRKQGLGTAENLEGRTALQVLANLAVAAAFAAIFALSGKIVFLLATAAALAEAAADTVSSELGQAHGAQARLITTWATVPAGTDGGVSVVGTLGGIAAAMIVTAVCVLADLVPRQWASLPLIAGVTGMIVDSYLGALFERRKLLNNNWVNFVSTCVAAGVALVFSRFVET
jgi:uncharacterized protein (TIGR00297 family)